MRQSNSPHPTAHADLTRVLYHNSLLYLPQPLFFFQGGTKFGLETPEARIESIFCSMPLLARWEYKHEAEPGSPEDALMQVLMTPKDWV